NDVRCAQVLGGVGDHVAQQVELAAALYLVAVDPSQALRFATRFGVADRLGGLDPASRAARIFSTPAAWLQGARAWQLAEAARVDEARAAAAAIGAESDAWPLPPGRHGLCVLDPGAANWPALLFGKTQIWCDRPALGAAIRQQLRADRKRVVGRSPKIMTGSGGARHE
ncbi:MAG: hypothetical protein QGF20_02075, partial [Alphaproteobacteria bacterium]|nr:hypothetical protein [Alphaproteobacteria bacterium]